MLSTIYKPTNIINLLFYQHCPISGIRSSIRKQIKPYFVVRSSKFDDIKNKALHDEALYGNIKFLLSFNHAKCFYLHALSDNNIVYS